MIFAQWTLYTVASAVDEITPELGDQSLWVLSPQSLTFLALLSLSTARLPALLREDQELR